MMQTSCLLIKDAAYKQLAKWDDTTNRVFVDVLSYDGLSEFNKAALILHEAVYKVSRKLKDTQNSDSTRKLVAELLSVNGSAAASLDFLYNGAGIFKTDSHEIDIKVNEKELENNKIIFDLYLGDLILTNNDIMVGYEIKIKPKWFQNYTIRDNGKITQPFSFGLISNYRVGEYSKNYLVTSNDCKDLDYVITIYIQKLNSEEVFKKSFRNTLEVKDCYSRAYISTELNKVFSGSLPF